MMPSRPRTDMEMETLSRRLQQILTLDPAAVAVETEGRTWTWGDIAAAEYAIEESLRAAGVSPDAPVGWMAHK